MLQAHSCGGVVVYRGKVLLLYRNYQNRNDGWVMPKGTVEPEETPEQTALREVQEESGVRGRLIRFISDSSYQFYTGTDWIRKTVSWYLMAAESYDIRPQREEYFFDGGYYKIHEARHLLKFDNERDILMMGYAAYRAARREGGWPADA